MQATRVVLQELLDVEQNNFDEDKTFEFGEGLSRLQFVGVACVALHCYAAHVRVFDVTVESDFHVDDVVLAEVTLENVN